MLVFLIITFCLIALPMIPSLVELYFATDIKPLKISQQYDANTEYFAEGFRDYIEKNFTSLFSGNASINTPKDGALRDKTRFLVVGSNGAIPFEESELSRHLTKRLIISDHALTLPENMAFELEIYSRDTITSGGNNKCRALLAEQDVFLKAGTSVFRWVHSGNDLQVASGCNLYGRASAHNRIIIKGECNFQRLHANQVIFGTAPLLVRPALLNTLTKIEKLPRIKDRFERRWLINGSVKLPANSLFEGDIIATKSVRIGAGSVINGSIKANKNLYIEDNVTVNGSVVSVNTLMIQSNCFINGQVIAEGRLVLNDNITIGASDSPVTVSADTLKIKGNAVIYGSIRANNKASFIPDAKKIVT